MKESTKGQFKKLSELTSPKCAQCPGQAQTRCCDKMFCDLNKALATGKGYSLPEGPNLAGIPFMGENGCVLSPEQRPYCTGYVCPPHFADREFRRQYDRILEKIARDPEAPPMPEIMAKNRAIDTSAVQSFWRFLKK
jgi:hypothetical protein